MTTSQAAGKQVTFTFPKNVPDWLVERFSVERQCYVVPLSWLIRDTRQPRQKFKGLADLSRGMEREQIDPIGVRLNLEWNGQEDQPRLIIKRGGRRYESALLGNLELIDVRLVKNFDKPLTLAELTIDQISQGANTKDYTVYERAVAIRSWAEDLGKSLDVERTILQYADESSRSVASVQRDLRLLQLPEKMFKQLQDAEVPESVVQIVANYPRGCEAQETAARRAIARAKPSELQKTWKAFQAAAKAAEEEQRTARRNGTGAAAVSAKGGPSPPLVLTGGFSSPQRSTPVSGSGQRTTVRSSIGPPPGLIASPGAARAPSFSPPVAQDAVHLTFADPDVPALKLSAVSPTVKYSTAQVRAALQKWLASLR